MDLDLRLATPADIPALRELIPASVQGLSAECYTPAQIASALTYLFGVDTQLIADGTYFVVASAGQIAGAGGWSRRQTLYGGDQAKAEADPLLDPARDAARIRAFYVHPAWARRGIGRRILGACEAAARAAGFTRLELGATLPGEPLYTALGFRVTERIQVTLPDGEALAVAKMEKTLA